MIIFLYEKRNIYSFAEPIKIKDTFHQKTDSYIKYCGIILLAILGLLQWLSTCGEIKKTIAFAQVMDRKGTSFLQKMMKN